MNELILKAESKYNETLHDLKREKLNLKKDKKLVRETKEAQDFIQKTAQEIQQHVHRKISEIVTKCLEAVFNRPYQFKVLFERKRGRTEARLAFFRRANEVDPKDGAGGGMLDVAALALRLASLVLRPALAKLLIMDEPFKNINGEEYQQRAGALMETLAEEMGFQFIIVTDDDWLKVGKVVQMASNARADQS